MEQLARVLPPLAQSLANSAAILAWPQTHHQWVRPGIMLYGSSPFAAIKADELNLQPVMTLRSRLIATQLVYAGETVGYGGSWLATQDTRLGVVAICQNQLLLNLRAANCVFSLRDCLSVVI